MVIEAFKLVLPTLAPSGTVKPAEALTLAEAGPMPTTVEATTPATTINANRTPSARCALAISSNLFPQLV